MDEKVWLCMLSDRNNTVPVFDARSVFSFVQMAIQTYIPEFVRLRDRLLARHPGHAGVLGEAFD